MFDVDKNVLRKSLQFSLPVFPVTDKTTKVGNLHPIFFF